jgi:hypothetical protein
VYRRSYSRRSKKKLRLTGRTTSGKPLLPKCKPKAATNTLWRPSGRNTTKCSPKTLLSRLLPDPLLLLRRPPLARVKAKLRSSLSSKAKDDGKLEENEDEDVIRALDGSGMMVDQLIVGRVSCCAGTRIETMIASDLLITIGSRNSIVF